MIDHANLVQSIAQVAHLLTQIRNLQAQLENMIRNTQQGQTPWESALPLLIRIGGLLQQGQALGYTIKNIDQRFTATFPGYQPVKNWHQSYGMWTTTSLDTLRSVLGTLGIHGDAIAWDAARIASLALTNSSAVGRMAAIQAGNSIALEGIGRMQRLEQIAMAQSNAYAVIEANKINEQAQRDAFTRQWLLHGEGAVPAYTSQGPTRIPGVSR